MRVGIAGGVVLVLLLVLVVLGWSSLFTVYLRDDGTVFAGAVPAATLLAAAK